MKNSFGCSVSVSLFGESHGRSVGALLDGMAPGLAVDEGFIRHQMSLRRSLSALSTARQEEDEVIIESGVYEGKTTGTPICLRIENKQARSADYEQMAQLARPGHADFTAREKYHGFADLRGGGHFSGRMTAALVAAGAIAIAALRQRGIFIGTHIAACGGVCDRPFDDLAADIAALNEQPFAVLDETASARMQAAIAAAKAEGDSLGGVLESVVTGLPSGVGEPWFDTVEGLLSHILFSIPAVKGVEFGDGFAMAAMRGSEANDPFLMQNGRVVTETNHAGGILGGITTGMPLRVRVAIKPTPSICRAQRTVNFVTGESTLLSIGGRHDPAIVHRARVVVDSAIALALCDLLALRYGTDWLAGGCV
jgi:chorismate synthase